MEKYCVLVNKGRMRYLAEGEKAARVWEMIDIQKDEHSPHIHELSWVPQEFWYCGKSSHVE